MVTIAAVAVAVAVAVACLQPAHAVCIPVVVRCGFPLGTSGWSAVVPVVRLRVQLLLLQS